MTVLPPPEATLPVACILAGGRASRLGGIDKSLTKVGRKTILERIIERIGPQVKSTVLNANGDHDRFAATRLPVVADSVQGFAGPLAGILTGLEWTQEHSSEWMLSIPADTPFLPADLVARLRDALTGNDIACAASNGRRHHIVALWPVTVIDELRSQLTAGHLRKAEAFIERYRVGLAEWPGEPYDPFFNINRPQDVIEAGRIAREFGL